MKAFLAGVLALCVVAGCASRTNQAGDPQAYCERQAENDPEVVQLTTTNMAVMGPQGNLSGSIRLAKRRALQRCMIQQGVPMRGGVEPLAPG